MPDDLIFDNRVIFVTARGNLTSDSDPVLYNGKSVTPGSKPESELVGRQARFYNNE